MGQSPNAAFQYLDCQDHADWAALVFTTPDSEHRQRMRTNFALPAKEPWSSKQISFPGAHPLSSKKRSQEPWWL